MKAPNHGILHKPTVEEAKAQGWDEGAEFMDSDTFWHDGGRESNPYRSEAALTVHPEGEGAVMADTEWTTEDVRQIVAAVASRLCHVETHWMPEGHSVPMTTAEVLREFDSALAAHDAEVAAKALEDAMLAFNERFKVTGSVSMPVLREWWSRQLKARAAALRGNR